MLYDADRNRRLPTIIKNNIPEVLQATCIIIAIVISHTLFYSEFLILLLSNFTQIQSSQNQHPDLISQQLRTLEQTLNKQLT